MSNGFHNASIQAQAAKDAARQTARATAMASQAQIEHEKAVRKEREEKLAECIESFASLDESSLFRMGDKDLAHFQAQHPPEAPQYALALNEWNRRLITRQVRATQFASLIGFAGIIIGVVVGWFLASIDPPKIPLKNQKAADTQILDNHQGDEPDKISVKPKGEPKPQ